MTTISVPMPRDLLKFVDSIIASGEAENRAQAVRKAVRKMREQTEIDEIFEASLQIKQGYSYTGILEKYWETEYMLKIIYSEKFISQFESLQPKSQS